MQSNGKILCVIMVPGHPVETSIGMVAYGEMGYYATKWNDRKSLDEVRILVDIMNGRNGITHEIERSFMEASMVGWDAPCAKAAHDYVRLRETEGPVN